MNRGRSGKRGSLLRLLAVTAFGCLLLGLAVPVDAGGHDWPKMKRHAYDGPGWGEGGYWIGVLTPELDDLNDELVGAEFGKLDGSLLFFGGGGRGGVDNWSVGGGGGGGFISSSKGTQHAELSTGFGVMEVARHWSTGGLRFDAGAMFGGGGATLALTFDKPVDRADGIGEPHETHFDRGFFLVGPSVGVQFDITEHVAIQAKAAYLLTLGGSWKSGGNQIGGPPELSGPLFTVGFAFGG